LSDDHQLRVDAGRFLWALMHRLERKELRIPVKNLEHVPENWEIKMSYELGEFVMRAGEKAE
jgi:hypothetical protein